MGLEYLLTDQTTLIGSYQLGFSSMSGQGDSLIREFQGVTSSGFSVGMVTRETFTAKDEFGLSVSQPLRIKSGTAELSVPVFRDAAGNIRHETEIVSLAPEGRELSLQGWYARKLGEKTEFNIGGAFRHEPGHVKMADDEALGMVKLRREF